jgi:hypothetical protein
MCKGDLLPAAWSTEIWPTIVSKMADYSKRIRSLVFPKRIEIEAFEFFPTINRELASLKRNLPIAITCGGRLGRH